MNINLPYIKKSRLKVKLYPDPILLKKAEVVTEINKEIEKIFVLMRKAMKAYNAIGLAAPQVGVPLRLITVRRQNWVMSPYD